MGGPALHVAYLTRASRSAATTTTLAAGSLARGESSMSFVAEELGVRCIQSHSFIVRSRRSMTRFRSPDRQMIRGCGRTSCIHTLRRPAPLAASPPRSRVTPGLPYRPHLSRARAAGYFDPVTSALFRGLERTLAQVDDSAIAVSPEVRDDLVQLGVAPAEKFSVIRLGIDLDDRVTSDGEAPCFAASTVFLPTSSSSAGSAG